MTTGAVEPDESDFYTQLMTEIQIGNIRRAVLMITGLSERGSQLDVLLHLAHDLQQALEQALEEALVVTHDLDHKHTHDLDQAHAQALARDLAHDYAHVIDQAHTQSLALEQALAHDAAHDLGRVFACARDVDHAFARAREHALYLDRCTHINKTIMDCLHVLMHSSA